MNSPWLRTGARSLVAAVPLALVLFLVVPRHAELWSDAFDVVLLALPGITQGLGWVVRFGGWFAGGLWCAVIARWLWFRYARDLAELPALMWGGVAMIVIQVLMLVVRNKRPSLK